MDIQNNYQLHNDSCYVLAYNILANEKECTTCIQTAFNSIVPSSTTNSEFYYERMVRHMAFEQYLAKYTYGSTYSEMTMILNELQECAANSMYNAKETIISLELSQMLDTFIRTLPERDINIFIRRYFFADSISSISAKYHIEENNIINVLSQCRMKLREYLWRTGHTFKVETLFRSFSDISNDLICEKKFSISTSDKKWIIPTSIVAGVLLFITLGIVIISNVIGESDEPAATFPTFGTFDIEPIEPPSDIYFDLPEEPYYMKDGCVDIDVLFDVCVQETPGSQEGIGISFSFSPEYTLHYVKCGTVAQEILADCASYININGFDSEDDPCQYFFLQGYDTLEYIITLCEGEYELWQYERTQMTDLSGETKGYYQFVLKQVYGLYSADSIQTISITHANPEAQDYSSIEEIVTGLRPDISCIYDALSVMGVEHNETLDHMSDIAHTFTDIKNSAYKLTITAIDGTVIDHLYYSPLVSRFYTENGYPFEQIDDETKAELEAIICFDDEKPTGN